MMTCKLVYDDTVHLFAECTAATADVSDPNTYRTVCGQHMLDARATLLSNPGQVRHKWPRGVRTTDAATCFQCILGEAAYEEWATRRGFPWP